MVALVDVSHRGAGGHGGEAEALARGAAAVVAPFQPVDQYQIFNELFYNIKYCVIFIYLPCNSCTKENLTFDCQLTRDSE